MGHERRPGPGGAGSGEGVPRLRLAPTHRRVLRLPIAPLPHPHREDDAAVSIEAVEARAASALAGLSHRNRSAGGGGSEESRPLPATDPRWVLAIRTAECLQGDVLPPAERTKLNRLGAVMGLTPFQCTLVIAIVQDEARGTSGVAPGKVSISDDAARTLTMVPPAKQRAAMPVGRIVAWTVVVLAVEAAALAALLL